MLYSEGQDKVIKTLNQYSSSGNLTPTTDASVIDGILRMPAFFDFTQKEIATTAKYIHKDKKISQNSIPYLFSDSAIHQFLLIDLIDMVAVGAQSYYFEVDNIATIYIEEYVNGAWQALPTPIIINNTAKGEFTSYSGFIVPSNSDNQVRIRFSGLYPYNVRNRALSAYLFPTVSDIPSYTEWVEYDMGNDYYDLRKVETNFDDSEWKWLGKDKIGIKYDAVGEITIFYKAYPTTINSLTPMTYQFEIDEEACQAMIFYVASQILIDDPVNKSVGERLYSIYQAKLVNMTNSITQGSKGVKNTMFKSYRNNLRR